MESRKKGSPWVEIAVILVIIAALAAALVPVVTSWNREVQESNVRDEGWRYLYAAAAIAEEAEETGFWPDTEAAATPPAADDGAAYYEAILSNPKFIESLLEFKWSQIPPLAEDTVSFPHINDFYIDDEGYPAAVFIHNVLKSGEIDPEGLIVGKTPDGGFWLRGGENPLAFG